MIQRLADFLIAAEFSWLDVIDILDVGGTQVEIPRKPLEFGANLHE